MNSKICSISRTVKDLMGIVEKELAIFKVEGQRGANLERCYENLNSIPHNSSVEPERVFSGCGRTVTKIRSSLHDFKIEINCLLIEKECQFKFLCLNLIFFYCLQLNLINGLKSL
jgi:hypothetical protein